MGPPGRLTDIGTGTGMVGGTGGGADGNDDAARGWASTPLRIPDNASELDGDRQAWLREVAAAGGQRAAARRRQRREDALARLRGRRVGPYGVPGSALGLVLVLVLAVAGLALFLGPGLTPSQQAVPLATPTTRPGEPGGLLPDTALRNLRLEDFPARSLRPAVLALVPSGCDCGEALAAVQAQTFENAVRLYLIAPDGGRRELDRLAGRHGLNAFAVVEDVDDALAGAYRSEVGRDDEAVLLFVHSDGVLRDARPLSAGAGGTSPVTLEPVLRRLGRPGA